MFSELFVLDNLWLQYTEEAEAMKNANDFYQQLQIVSYNLPMCLMQKKKKNPIAIFLPSNKASINSGRAFSGV